MLENEILPQVVPFLRAYHNCSLLLHVALGDDYWTSRILKKIIYIKPGGGQTLGPVISGMCIATALSPPPLVFNNVSQKNIKPGQAGDIIIENMCMHVISGIAWVCWSVALAITLFTIVHTYLAGILKIHRPQYTAVVLYFGVWHLMRFIGMDHLGSARQN